MIGEAFELCHQRPQIDGTGRNLDLHCGLDRMCKGQRVSDRAVARGAPCQARRRVEARARHQRLDAFVHVTEALLQPNHRLAVSGKTKMSGLDDAGMNRADGNLVQALAGGGQEGIRRAPRRSVAAISERVLDIPKAEIKPRPRVGRADRFESIKIAHRTLQANGWRMERPDGWKM